MMSSVNRPVALVTGASGGLGRAIARRLASDGYLIVAHYGKNAHGGKETVRLIVEEGGDAVSVGADLTRVEDIENMFHQVDAQLAEWQSEGIQVLVNNSGVAAPGTLDTIDEAAFDRVFQTNPKGTFFVTQYAVERMCDGASIVNISSMVSRAAYPASITYGMSKAAINYFSVALAADLAHRGISVNAVAPGATDTEFIGAVKSDTSRMEAVLGATAMRRLGQPDDIAGVVSFLTSDDGAWVTGQVIEASGGMHL